MTKAKWSEPEGRNVSIDLRWPRWLLGTFCGKLFYNRPPGTDPQTLPHYDRSRVFDISVKPYEWELAQAAEKNVLFVKRQAETIGELWLKRRFFNLRDVIRPNYWAECYFYVKFFDDPIINEIEGRPPYGRMIRPELEPELNVFFNKNQNSVRLIHGTFGIELKKQ
ncbi:MAG: hypothetical protein JJ872_10500 [Marivivens sp.]|nr:hypothetical protein [Marivivens sp.]